MNLKESFIEEFSEKRMFRRGLQIIFWWVFLLFFLYYEFIVWWNNFTFFIHKYKSYEHIWKIWPVAVTNEIPHLRFLWREMRGNIQWKFTVWMLKWPMWGKLQLRMCSKLELKFVILKLWWYQLYPMWIVIFCSQWQPL
jgi:hypothetical protein